MDLQAALNQFGLKEFRPGQQDVIESIVAGHDCMCVMPTGGGKSLCFQLPSVIRPGLTIVVSPLIALMKDQVDNLSRNGVRATLINSTLSQSEQSERLRLVAAGEYQLVYVAPERLRNSRFLETIRATPIQLLAVDEAHCISQWGHDFRPDYARIGRFRELLGGVQTVALTATATPRVREDIVHVLGLKKPRQFMSGFERPNLHFGVKQLPSDREKEAELEQFLKQADGTGIIYCATRKRCESVVEMISKKLKMSVGAYHAGLLPDQRKSIQDRFMSDDLKIVVATNAFGMGIDKPDLRYVIHYNMPGSLEAYYQEAGRAGRDGERSQCVMLYSFQDRHIQEFFIENSYPERSLIQAVYEFLISREEDPIELTLEEIRDRLGLSVSPEAIGSCLQVLARTDVLDRLETGGGLAVVKLDSQLPTLVDLLPREAKVQRQVLRALEKIVGDRRGEQVFFHPRWLLQQADLPRDAVQRALRELGRLEEFDYIPPFRGRAVHLRTRDVPFGDLNIDFAAIQRRKEAEYDRLNRVSQYAQSPLCRQANILQYFGDESADHCGRCDRCGRTVGWPVMPKTKSATGEETPNSITPTPAATSPALAAILEEVVDAIQRIHGRLGKHLIAQYLCGSQNAKVQKLKLHRLSGFGLLGSLKQADGVALLDALLAAGALRQQEVNRNRPTLSVAPEIMQAERRRHVLTGVQVDGKLNSKLEKIARSRPGSGTAQPATVARSQTEPTVTKHQGVPPEPEDLFGARDSSHRPESDRPLAEAKKDPNRQLTNTHPGDDASHASQPKSSETRASEVSNNSETGGADWNWTVHLFEQGHNWETVRTIRRMKDEELAASLCVALRQGAKLSRKWFSPPDDTPRTSGQQRVLREVRRREAAGVA